MSASAEALEAYRQGLREALRALVLPVAPDREDAAVDAVGALLSDQGVALEDQARFIWLELASCRERQALGGNLATVAEQALRAGDPRFGRSLADRYADLHQRLQTGSSLSYDQASGLLGQARLAARLAAEEGMSSAQVAEVLSVRDRRMTFGWRPVKLLLEQLGLGPTVNVAQVEALHQRDLELEQELLADADAAVSTAVVGQAAGDLGFPGDLGDLLLQLAGAGGPPFWPYLQILHYQCVIADFYDHPVTVLYEFSPRGAAAHWVFDQYAAAHVPTGNPVLNNAKAVDRLDREWASSRVERNSDPRAARALVEILEGLEDMAFLARRELAAWLRRWLLRLMRLLAPVTHTLPSRPSPAQVQAVLASVAAGETGTVGIIEQRVVDALASMRHREADGWRARGLGDPVNASNLSRKKLGDCDFQDANARAAVAYEAHAGRLSEIYLAGHRQTLARVLPARIEEWEGVADRSAWSVEVTYVAHDFAAQPPPPTEVEGVQVAVTFSSHADLVRSAPPAANLVDCFEERVHRPLNDRRTPDAVRQVYLAIMVGAGSTLPGRR